MTNEEAISYFINSNERIISVAKDENSYNYETQQIENVFMRRGFEANEKAINALDQQLCKNCISREKAKQFLYERVDRLNDDELYDIFSRIIDDMYNELPLVTPSYNSIKTELKPCEDCISREEVRRILGNEVFELMKLHTVNPEDNPKADAMAYGVNWSLNTLMDLPSVKPERPQGKWMECSGDEPWLKGYCCSLCNFTTTQKYGYCTCGAKMEVNADDGDSN